MWGERSSSTLQETHRKIRHIQFHDIFIAKKYWGMVGVYFEVFDIQPRNGNSFFSLFQHRIFTTLYSLMKLSHMSLVWLWDNL